MGKRIRSVSEGGEKHKDKRPKEPRDKEAGSDSKEEGGGGGPEKEEKTGNEKLFAKLLDELEQFIGELEELYR